MAGALPLFGSIDATTVGQLVVSGLLKGSVYALLGVSFWLIYATTQTFHLAHSVTYATAGFTTVVVSKILGLPLVVGAVAALLVAAALGVVMNEAVYRPLRHRGAGVLGIFLASLGLATAGPNLLQLIFGPQGRDVPGFPEHTFAVGGVTFTLLALLEGIVAALAIGGVAAALARSRVGQAVNGARTNPEMAVSVGIALDRIYLLVFAVGSALAGIAAFFETANFVATPTMGVEPVLYGFIGMFVGGVATVGGAALGGFVVGFLTVASGLFLSQDVGVLLVFGVLVVVLIWRPEGLVRAGAAGS
jgi:branched-chain amino acid transport system permease protein